MPDPLQNSQQRWEQFFAQQGRQMPQVARPMPQQAAPQAPQQPGQRTPLLDRFRAMQEPPRDFWANLMWRAAHQGQAPQQAQQQQPRTGFFGRRGTY
jgi:hypothetical protein